MEFIAFIAIVFSTGVVCYLIGKSEKEVNKKIKNKIDNELIYEKIRDNHIL